MQPIRAPAVWQCACHAKPAEPDMVVDRVREGQATVPCARPTPLVPSSPHWQWFTRMIKHSQSCEPAARVKQWLCSTTQPPLKRAALKAAPLGARAQRAVVPLARKVAVQPSPRHCYLDKRIGKIRSARVGSCGSSLLQFYVFRPERHDVVHVAKTPLASKQHVRMGSSFARALTFADGGCPWIWRRTLAVAPARAGAVIRRDTAATRVIDRCHDKTATCDSTQTLRASLSARGDCLPYPQRPSPVAQ
jgi:hypothetical protein